VSVEGHRHEAPPTLAFAVLTVSDTREATTDRSGTLVAELVDASAHRTIRRELCRDETGEILATLDRLSEPGIDVIVVTGGTGPSPRDVTPEALRSRYEIELPGFGELFRALSWQEVGSAAMLSRASAGVLNARPVFSLPGSPAAVRLGMEKLVLPEAAHLVGQLRIISQDTARHAQVAP